MGPEPRLLLNKIFFSSQIFIKLSFFHSNTRATKFGHKTTSKTEFDLRDKS